MEVNAGNLDRALDLADDALEAAFDASNPQASAWVRYPAGLAHAHLGDEVGVADDAAELRSWGVDHDQPPRTLMAAPRPRSRRARAWRRRPPRRWS